ERGAISALARLPLGWHELAVLEQPDSADPAPLILGSDCDVDLRPGAVGPGGRGYRNPRRQVYARLPCGWSRRNKSGLRTHVLGPQPRFKIRLGEIVDREAQLRRKPLDVLHAPRGSVKAALTVECRPTINRRDDLGEGGAGIEIPNPYNTVAAPGNQAFLSDIDQNKARRAGAAPDFSHYAA